MRTPTLLRALTPWGWLLLAAGVLGATLLLLDGLGFRWDPLDMTGRRMRKAEARASLGTEDAAARRSEVEGAAEQARRLEALHQQDITVARINGRAETQARIAHDADTMLDPDRAARLRNHDRELCRVAPAVCGAAKTDAAGRSDQALPAGALAADADPGGS